MLQIVYLFMQMVRLVYGHIMFMHKRPFFFKLLAISSNGCFFFFTFYHSRGKIWSVYGKMTCSKGNPPTKTKTKKRENVDQILFHVSLLNGKQMPLHSLRNLNKSSTFFHLLRLRCMLSYEKRFNQCICQWLSMSSFFIWILCEIQGWAASIWSYSINFTHLFKLRAEAKESFLKSEKQKWKIATFFWINVVEIEQQL